MLEVRGRLRIWSIFVLQLLLLLQDSNSTHLSHPRKLLQHSSNSSTPADQCPQSSFQCTAPPCSIWPCLQGWTAQNDYCTCKCNCTSPPGFTGLSTNTSSNVSKQPATRLNAAVAAEEAQISQPQLPGQQVAANGSCARLYQPCTCSAQCCGGLVCGFPLRQPLNARLQAIADAAVAAAVQQELSQQAANATNSTSHMAAPANITMNGSVMLTGNPTSTAAPESWNSTGTVARLGVATPIPIENGSDVIGGDASEAGMFVDTGGPSCRPAELLDLRSGVVNYGC